MLECSENNLHIFDNPLFLPFLPSSVIKNSRGGAMIISPFYERENGIVIISHKEKERALVPRGLPYSPCLTAAFVPGGRGHDTAALLGRRLHTAAVRVVAEAKAVTYLVGHGGCCANGKLRVVLRGSGDSRGRPRGRHLLPQPFLAPLPPAPCSPLLSGRWGGGGGAHRAHASGALRATHALYGRQAHGVALEGAAPEGRMQHDLEEPGFWAARSGPRVGVGGTHVSSCAESCGRRALSPRRQCRKAQSVVLASGVTRL